MGVVVPRFCAARGAVMLEYICTYPLHHSSDYYPDDRLCSVLCMLVTDTIDDITSFDNLLEKEFVVEGYSSQTEM
jgi:hypothetical protein